MDQKIHRIMFIHNSITHEIFIDYIKAYLEGNDLKFSVLNMMIIIRQRKDKFIARDVIDIDVLLYLFTKDELKSFLEKHNSITGNKFIAHSFMSVYTADNIRKIIGGICV